MNCYSESQLEQVVWGKAEISEEELGHLFRCDRCRERYLTLATLHHAMLKPALSSLNSMNCVAREQTDAAVVVLQPLALSGMGNTAMHRLAARGEQPAELYSVSSFANPELGMVGRLLYNRQTRHLTLYLIAESGEIPQGFKVTLGDGRLAGYADSQGSIDFGQQPESKFDKVEITSPRGAYDLSLSMLQPDPKHAKQLLKLPGHPLAEIELETGAIRLADFLQSEASPMSKRLRFFQFFRQFTASTDQLRFLSYYLQFAPFLLPLCHELTQSSTDPEELCAWLKVTDHFKRQAPEHLTAITEAENKIRISAILHALYAADLRSAAGLLGIEWAEEPAPSASRLTVARLLASRAPLGLRDELMALLQEWENKVSAFSANSMLAVLIDSSTITTSGAGPQGVVLALHAEARERPADAEEDRGLINNQVNFGKQALYWTIMDGLLAARANMAPGTAQSFYTVHYSLSEKSAEVSGTSLGLAAALLAWVTSRNRHYRSPVVRIASSAAVTGGIRVDGAVTAVDSLSLGAKISATFFSPVERLFLPAANIAEAFRLLAELEQRYPNRRLLLQPIETLSQALQDRNLVEGIQPSLPGRALAAVRRTRHKPLIAGLAAAAALGLLFAFVPAMQWWRDRTPAQWIVEGQKLIIQNEAGERLWSYRFECTLNPQVYAYPGAGHVLLDDINGDGRIEVLAGISDSNAPAYSGTLFGFDDQGHALWPPLKPGRILRNLEGEEIPNIYDMSPIKTVTIATGQPKMILTSVNSHGDFPGMLALIDHRGRLQGSYWNSSHITRCFAQDITGDGRPEIIATLYGNEDGRARLAAFSIDDMHGASPQSSSHYILDGIPLANHLKLYRFPATPFVERPSFNDMIDPIDRWSSGFRIYITNPGVYSGKAPDANCSVCSYFFDAQLEPVSMFDPPDLTLSRLKDALGHPFAAADRRRLEIIDEWDGTSWRPRPIGTAAKIDRPRLMH
jgi:hypothetical protein